MLLFENVKNLVSHDSGQTFKVISSEIRKRGYHLDYRVLDSSVVTGIPHARERIFIVAFRDPMVLQRFVWPEPHNEAVCSITQLYESDPIPETYYYNQDSAIWGKLVEAVTKESTVYQYRRYYVRENKSGVCPTLTANMGTGGHNVPIILDSNKRIRKLTPRECFRLQGFPDSYILPETLSRSKLYFLAGNAVTVGVVESLLCAIKAAVEAV